MKRVVQPILLFTFFFLFTSRSNLNAQSTGTLQTDGAIYKFGYAGGNEKYRDFTIPADHDPVTDFNQITFALRGGDGGRRRIQGICTEPGGKGARVDASFAIGYGEGKLNPGGIIRIVVGQQGTSLKSGGLAGAGGGGGSAILYHDPDIDGNACQEDGFDIPSIEWDTTCWILLAVAGGGGGAYAPGGCAQASSGKPGNGGTNGTDGKGITAGSGGSNGQGGEEGDGYGGAGGGYRPKSQKDEKDGEHGGLTGGGGGDSDILPGFIVRGGYGYGGGGAGLRTWLIVRGGAGGGFSGGGYGSQYEGGGGGGSFANQNATSFDKRDGNGTDKTPNNGYVSYFLNFNNELVDAPNAVCQDTTVYIIGEEQTINAAEIAYNSTDPNDRPLTYCFDFGDACSPNIGFDCFDLGDEEVYTVRVDNGFTSSTCTVNLEIQQGTPGMLDCPGAQTISITDCDGVLVDGQTNPGEGQLFLAPFEFPTCEYTLEYYIQRPDGSIDTDHQSDNAVEGIQSDTFDLGTSLVVYTVGYEDEDGVEHAQTCVISITVEGQENFSINCPNNISINIPNGDIDPENPCSFFVEHGIGPGAYDLTPNVGGCGELSYTITHPDILNPMVMPGTGQLDEYDFPVGISTVEYTLERLPGELYTCSFTVEIDQSTQPPAISNCPEGDVHISIFQGITNEEILEQISFDVNDDCGIASIELENLDLSCAELGNRQENLRLIVTDTDGNTDFCRIDVRTDEEKFIACPEDIVIPTEVGFCFAAILEESLAPTAIPVCPFNYSYGITDLNNNTTITSGSGNIPQQVLTAGQYQVYYTWQNGNFLGSCSFNVHVIDEEAPEIVCQDVTVNLSELPPNPADLLLVSATDDCSTTFTASIDESFDCDDLGFNTVIVTVADESGNEAVCGAVLNIIDDVIPVITTCPEDRTITLDANCEATLPDLTGEIVGMSNCGTATPVQFPAAGILLSAGDGIIEVSVNLVEEGGQEATVPCTVQITVPDDAPPSAVCQDITVSLVGDSQTISASDIDNESSDDCGIANRSLDRTSFNCADVGNNTVTLTITDNADNSATCTASVTVQDNTPPTAACQNATVQLNSTGNAALSPAMIDNSSSDICGLQPLAVSPTSFGCNEVGGTTATLTVTDQSGNSSTCTVTVTVQDNVAPIASCQDITIQLNATGMGAAGPNEVNNGSSDACGIQSMTLDQELFTCSDVGSKTLTLTVTDQNGNSNTCTATAMVEDNTAPVAICQPATVQLDGFGNGSLPANNVNGGSNDICGIQFLSINAESFDCTGPTTVTLTVTDFNGNSSTCTAAVTIVDVTSPVANCQSVTVQLAGNGMGILTADEVDNASSDACSVTSRSLDQSTFTCADVGSSQTVTLTVSDGAGNSSTCSAVVTVEDGVAPLAQCQPVTVQLDAAGMGTLMPEAVDKASSDPCGISNVELDVTTFTCNEVGSGNTVYLTVTDNHNNTSSCSATVTVEDNVAPTALCQDATVSLDENGQGSITADEVDNGSSDACPYEPVPGSVSSIMVQPNTFDCDHIGGNTVTLTVEDVNGNTATCTATVKVEDNAPPQPICNNLVITFNGEDVIGLTIAALWNEAASTDNCNELFYIGASLDEIGCEQVGSIIPVTVSVEDATGNLATCIATVTVQGLSCDWTSETMNCSEEATASFDPNNGTFELEAGGCYDPNYYSNNDAQSMIQQELCGDGEIIAHVTNIDGDAWAGVFMRESNDPGSKMLQLAVGNSGLAQRRLRTSTGGTAFNHLFQNQGKFWVRLTRSGTQFGAFLSLDGINWDLVLMTNIPMTNCIQTGLFLSNTSPGSTATAWFDNVQIKPPNGQLAMSNEQLAIANNPTGQLPNTPTTQYPNAPTPQYPNIQSPIGSGQWAVTNTQYANTPTTQYPNTPTPQYPNTPTPKHPNILLKPSLTLYPNPTDGEIHIVLDDFMDQALQIAIYNQQGQMVKSRELEPSHSRTERLRLYDLKDGLYLIQVRTETNTISKKISLIR